MEGEKFWNLPKSDIPSLTNLYPGMASTLGTESERSITPFAGRAVVDYVFIENLSFNAVVGPDAWGRKDKPQQVLISVKWYNDISGADDINSTLSYSKISKDITEAVKAHSKGFPSVQAVMDLVLFVVVDKEWGGIALELEVHLPKALLQASGGLRYKRGYTPNEQSMNRMPFPREKLYPSAVIEDINALCIIGVNPHERLTKQQVKVQLTIEEDLAIDAPQGIRSHWQGLVGEVLQVCLLKLMKLVPC